MKENFNNMSFEEDNLIINNNLSTNYQQQFNENDSQ
jgi:hypothetical protein